MTAVARTVNKSLGFPATADKLNAAMEWTWPKLSIAIENIRAQAGQRELIKEPKRTPEEMFEEIVVAIREQANTLSEIKRATLRSSIANKQLELTTEALQNLSNTYGRAQLLSVKELSAMSHRLNSANWRMIETAPFLLWYLEYYYGVKKPDPQQENLNDVPF